jgi:hypothetical protein
MTRGMGLENVKKWNARTTYVPGYASISVENKAFGIRHIFLSAFDNKLDERFTIARVRARSVQQYSYVQYHRIRYVRSVACTSRHAYRKILRTTRGNRLDHCLPNINDG